MRRKHFRNTAAKSAGWRPRLTVNSSPINLEAATTIEIAGSGTRVRDADSGELGADELSAGAVEEACAYGFDGGAFGEGAGVLVINTDPHLLLRLIQRVLPNKRTAQKGLSNLGPSLEHQQRQMAPDDRPNRAAPAE